MHSFKGQLVICMKSLGQCPVTLHVLAIPVSANKQNGNSCHLNFLYVSPQRGAKSMMLPCKQTTFHHIFLSGKKLSAVAHEHQVRPAYFPPA